MKVINLHGNFMKILGIIPTRYASSRFPGKALADVGGKPMLQRVYEQSQMSSFLSQLVVATDDERIFDTCIRLNIPVEMTADYHRSGTDRCAEVAKNHPEYEAIISIHCDEPFIMSNQIDILAKTLLQNSTADIVTLAKFIQTQEELCDSDVVKIVFGYNMEAIYMSRHPIPYYAFAEKEEWLLRHQYYKHIGLYGFKRETLLEVAALNVSYLETSENLEALRWIENDYNVKVALTDYDSLEINTPEDLAELLTRKQNI